MAAYEVLLLNTAVPQIQAAQSGDTYVVPRDIAFSAALTLSAGTANGVPYLNASKVLTTGSALTFDGTDFSNTAGKVIAGGDLRATITGTGNVGLNLVRSSGVAADWYNYIPSGSADLAWFKGSELMRLTSTGLGIGTSSPAYKLDVESTTTNPTIRIRSSGGVIGNYAELLLQTFNSFSAVGQAYVRGVSTASGNSNTDLTFGVNASGFGSPYEAMRLDSSGNLGIGTSSPAYKLDVTVGSLSGAKMFKFSGASGQSMFGYVDAGGVGITRTDPYNSMVYLSTSNTVEIYTASTQRAVFDSSGNLGLGVTPSAWRSTTKALQGTAGAIYDFSTTGKGITQNAFLKEAPDAWTYVNNGHAAQLDIGSGQFAFYTAPSGTANTTTVTSGKSYTIVTAGGTNYTSFGAANNNVGTTFTATSSGTGNGGGVTQNIQFVQAMTLDASGNLLVGDTTNPDSRRLRVYGVAEFDGNLISLTIYKSSGTKIGSSGQGDYVVSGGPSDGFAIQSQTALVFGSGGLTERARITSGGYFKASNTGTYTGSTGSYAEFYQSNDNAGLLVNTVNASFASETLALRANRNTTNNSFYAIGYYNDAAAEYKLLVADSGNVTNRNNSYGGISDQKLKSDIVDAGSQWNDIKAIKFRKFKMKNDPQQIVQLGVVAQEVELTSPGLVDEHQDRDAEGNDLGTTTKSVKTSVLLMKAAVALQEAMARIETLEAKTAALEQGA